MNARQEEGGSWGKHGFPHVEIIVRAVHNAAAKLREGS